MSDEHQHAGAPFVADGREHHLDPRVIGLRQRVGLLVSALVATATALQLLILWAGDGPSDRVMVALAVGGVVVNGMLAWHLQRWPAIAYRHTTYRVDAQGIEIRRGVYWKVVVNVPRSRVQHTDVSQGPLERTYGLGTLVVYTAGTDHARVTLAGLEHAAALKIREHLLPGEGADAV